MASAPRPARFEPPPTCEVGGQPAPTLDPETLSGMPPNDTELDLPPFPIEDDDFSDVPESRWGSRLWSGVKRRLGRSQ